MERGGKKGEIKGKRKWTSTPLSQSGFPPNSTSVRQTKGKTRRKEKQQPEITKYSLLSHEKRKKKKKGAISAFKPTTRKKACAFVPR